MEWGKCDGWVHIFVVNGDPMVRVTIKHKHKHSSYEDISLPEKWKQFIQDNVGMSPQKVGIYRHSKIYYLVNAL
jgi:hypothetical protein